MPKDCTDLIDRLIERRKSQGITQKELAQATSLTQSVIARLESKRIAPQLDTLFKIVTALGCDLELVPKEQNA